MTVGVFRSRRYLRLVMPFLLLLTALALPSARGALADPVLPSKTARVVDAADILRSNQERSLNAQLDALKQRSGVELVVVTLPGLQGYSIEAWGRALGEGWYVGGKNGLGALLIVAPNDRQVRIEVGDALSGRLTDSEASVIIERRIIPQFRSGELSGGIIEGVDAMIREASPVASSSQVNTLKSAPAGASWDSSVRAFLSRIDWAPLSMPLLGGIILLLMFWLLRRLGRQMDAVQSVSRTPDDADESPGWLEWLRVVEDNNSAGWLVRRRDRESRSSGFNWSFGSSGSGSSSASRGSWSGSGSSGSWGSSRSSSSSGRSSSSSSGRSSGGFSGRGASGRW